jgi:hypothetical protein
MNDFKECGMDPNKPIDMNTFLSWISRDHNLYLSYANKGVVLATNLLFLDLINYTDQENLMKYPSFK